MVLVLLQVPKPPPPVHATELYVPAAAAPVIGCGAVPQVVVAAPTEVIEGAGAHTTDMVATSLVPKQKLFPVAVSVNVYCPDSVVGVNVGAIILVADVIEPVPLTWVAVQPIELY